ncbi:nucleotidyl transferase AbiEii/AbiGii toxin family protein [Inquilinus sp. NPDC058860]|uniref:nucleotidyl transferase AbiEii/AbiGii toxin family protein n=1 Tax=Inquilinus sp. NPDC058860 TaxID=3346652 RepID=UPI0036AEFFFA
MIDKREIEAQSKIIGVHHANVERDYVFGWLLKAVYENAYLSEMLIFKGGNCMRKAFYQNTRFSSDLDFSVLSDIDVGRMQAEINQACAAAHQQCGVLFDTDKNTLRAETALDAERQSYKGRIYFRDFYGNSDSLLISIRIDLTEFDRLYLPIVTRPLIHPYSDEAACQAQLRCVALEELLANKLKCLIQRRHSFDLYDFVYATFFDESININRSLVLSTFLRKTIFERSPGAAKEILLGLPMPFFRAAWQKYVAPIVGRFDFDRAEVGFRSSIEAIFQDIVSSRWQAAPFFPSSYRNVIMEAGAERRLLSLTYDDGRPRLVEPYALAYKRKKDGEAAEYFYVWDRTGGRSSDPGVKTFFHHKIRRLELEDEVFEPRFPIELTKAGEKASKDYFGKDFGSGRAGAVARPRPISRKWVSRSSMTHKVECPYCLKRFVRKTRSTVLRPHKDPNGYPCSGRRGYYVT